MKSAYQQIMEEKLTLMIDPTVTEYGCELVELQYVQRKARALVRVLVDKQGGVTVDDCAAISHRISFLMDTSDPLDGQFILEVSSPGLDRPLTTPADFRRKVGELVKLSLKNETGNGGPQGQIMGVSDTAVTLRTEAGEEHYRLTDIIKGRIIF